MQIIIQGLRRSGTTILYDLISEDNRFTSFYEPFSRGKPSIGGGSGISQVDVMENLRESREQFSKIMGIEEINYNYGAPFNYKLEVGKKKLPVVLSKYISWLSQSDDNVLLKFTRGTFLINEFLKFVPDSVFIHVYKNPALWTMSHIFGKNYNKVMKTDADAFFEIKDEFNFWSQESIANYYIGMIKPDYIEKPAYFKLLYIWKEFNEIVRNDGIELFGKNYLSINNYELIENPKKILDIIYSYGDLEVPKSSIAWANQNLKPSRDIVHKKDSRWFEAFSELGINQEYLL